MVFKNVERKRQTERERRNQSKRQDEAWSGLYFARFGSTTQELKASYDRCFKGNKTGERNISNWHQKQGNSANFSPRTEGRIQTLYTGKEDNFMREDSNPPTPAEQQPNQLYRRLVREESCELRNLLRIPLCHSAPIETSPVTGVVGCHTMNDDGTF